MRETARRARRKPDQIEQLHDALARRAAPADDAVQAQRPAEDLAHGHARIERSVRVLEDHLHAPAQRPDRRLASRG